MKTEKPLTKNAVLKKYMKFRKLKNKTKSGRADIEFHINKFLKHTRKPLDEFDEDMLTDYVIEINDKYKTNMANTVKSSFIKNFVKWYFIDWSSRFRNLQTICATEKPDATYTDKDMLSEEDVAKMIREEDSSFWKAYFLTYFYGGCRPIEVIKLKWEDVEFEDDGAYFTIHSKKNKKDFTKYVPSDVAFYLEKLKNNNSEYIFINPKTKKLITTKGAYWKIRKMSEKSLGKKINLYVMRHSIATINYAKIGNDIEEKDVANSMGHSKSMRETYEHKNKKKLKANARKIYFKPEDLPPEKRHELEKEIDDLKARLEGVTNWQKTFHKSMQERSDKIMTDFMKDFKKENEDNKK